MAYSNPTGLPSVTTIIGAVSAHWMPTDFYTEEGRARGSAVHAYCAQYAQGKYCAPLPKQWAGYGLSFRRWADQYIVEVFAAEERLVCDQYRYTGQIDLLCEINGQRGPGLPDIKTGAKSKAHPVQIAAYRHLMDNNHKTNWGGILRLKADGGMPLFDATPNDYALDFNIFLSMLNVFNYYQGGK